MINAKSTANRETAIRRGEHSILALQSPRSEGHAPRRALARECGTSVQRADGEPERRRVYQADLGCDEEASRRIW